MSDNSGIPYNLLRNCQGKKITVHADCGDIYKGELMEAEEKNLSVHLKKVKVTMADGSTSEMKLVYLRGSHIRFIVLPQNYAEKELDCLKKAKSRGGNNTSRSGRGGSRRYHGNSGRQGGGGSGRYHGNSDSGRQGGGGSGRHHGGSDSGRHGSSRRHGFSGSAGSKPSYDRPRY